MKRGTYNKGKCAFVEWKGGTVQILKKGRYEKGRELFLFNGGTYHKEKGHLLERESGSYEKGKELSLFNGGTY